MNYMEGEKMKKIKKYAVFIVLPLVVVVLGGVFWNNYNYSKKIKLKIIKNDGVMLLTQDLESSGEYEIILDSSLNIIDKKNNNVSNEELEIGEIVEVYYSGAIKETYPAVFEKVNKIVSLD